MSLLCIICYLIISLTMTQYAKERSKAILKSLCHSAMIFNGFEPMPFNNRNIQYFTEVFWFSVCEFQISHKSLRYQAQFHLIKGKQWRGSTSKKPKKKPTLPWNPCFEFFWVFKEIKKKSSFSLLAHRNVTLVDFKSYFSPYLLKFVLADFFD